MIIRGRQDRVSRKKQSRRRNNRVDSIPTDDHETKSITEIRVKHTLQEKLNPSFEPEIESTHRVGGSLRS